MIKVLIVEDSPTAREHLTYILNSDLDIQVIGTAKDGEEALRFLERERPNLILMDIHMPKMDGFQATRKIMETSPVPIIIMSASWNPPEVEKSFNAMEVGAVAVIEKPRGGYLSEDSIVSKLIQTVKLMAEVKVVRRWRHSPVKPLPAFPTAKGGHNQSDVQLVAVGASTGGPLALQTIFGGLPKDFPAPVLVVQHIATGFTTGLVEWLNQTSPLPVHVPTRDTDISPGHIYVAPEGYQMKLESVSRILFIEGEPENGFCPSVGYLFRSAAEVAGKHAVGVLLTGMGRDGAVELQLMKEKGATTIAQDRESSVIYGMPGEAVKINAATHILPVDKIAATLRMLVGQEP